MLNKKRHRSPKLKLVKASHYVGAGDRVPHDFSPFCLEVEKHRTSTTPCSWSTGASLSQRSSAWCISCHLRYFTAPWCRIYARYVCRLRGVLRTRRLRAATRTGFAAVPHRRSTVPPRHSRHGWGLQYWLSEDFFASDDRKRKDTM